MLADQDALFDKAVRRRDRPAGDRPGHDAGHETSLLPLLLPLAVLLLLLVLVFPVFLVAILLFLAVGETRIAQSRADGQHAPTPDVLHERHFGQTLHDAVIVHQHRGVVTADLWDRFNQTVGQIEFAALPVARQV